MNHRALLVELFFPIKRNILFEILILVNFVNDAYFVLFLGHREINDAYTHI